MISGDGGRDGLRNFDEDAAPPGHPNCVSRYIPPKPTPRERPSEPSRPEFPAGYQTGPTASSYEETLANTPDEVLIAEARRVLVAAQGAPLGNSTLPTGSRSLYNAVYKAAVPPRVGGATRQVGVVLRTTVPPFLGPTAAGRCARSA